MTSWWVGAAAAVGPFALLAIGKLASHLFWLRRRRHRWNDRRRNRPAW